MNSGLIGRMMIPILSRTEVGKLEVIKEEKGMLYG